MNKTLLYLTVVISVAVISLGSYYVVTHTALHFEAPSAATPTTVEPTSDSSIAPKPNHGDFQKRFEPKPPPAKGSKS
jgi:hypothetical protein